MVERAVRLQHNLPDPPANAEALPSYIRQHLIPAILVALREAERPFPAAYSPTNVTEDRAFNAALTTVNELANVLGTLIADLQRKGAIV